MEATELISRCKADDNHALHLLYQQYKPKLLGICKQYAKEDDVAEDLLHDSFVIILTSLDRLEDPEKLESWMASIVRSVGYHYRLRADKEQAVLHQLAKERPETSEVHLAPDYEQLQALVAQLPQGYQQVFRLSVFERLSHQEISEILGIAPHSSSSQLAHAKKMLRILIKRSWVLILLLIAIPTAIWQFLNKQEDRHQEPVTQGDGSFVISSDVTKEPSPCVTRPQHPIRYQTEAVIQPDSIPSYIVEQTDTLTEMLQAVETEEKKEKEESKPDTLIYQQIPLPTLDDTEFIATAKAQKPKKSSWNIMLAYHANRGGRDENIVSKDFRYIDKMNSLLSQLPNLPHSGIIPELPDDSDIPTDNWIDFNNYMLSNTYLDLESRSLAYIAIQENHEDQKQEASYHHKQPFSIQLLLSRQLTPKLSIETGLSYTQLETTATLGSPATNIYEQQRINYLGIPLRFGWKWFDKAHFSLYSSAGAMFEIPVYRKLDVKYYADDINTLSKEETFSVPNQWSATFGIGVEYDFTPHLGFYVEPSIQYFFDDGSDLKTYRTEHPLQITLPLGIRFRW